MSMQRIEEYAMSIDAKHALFIFDSCFSGSLFALSRAVPEHISYKTAKPVRQFITSGSADEKVPDTSIFRQQFIAALGGEGDQNGDGYLTGAELSEFIFKNVVNYSRGAQHPQYGKIRNPNLDKGDFVFRMAQPEDKKTDLSDSSSLIELERQQLAKEKESFERERKELEQLKLLVMQRQKLEADRANLASQKDVLESKPSSESTNNQLENIQVEKPPEESIKVEKNLDEVERLKTQLASLGISPTSELNEIGRDGNFIAYDDGTVLDTKSNLMWWSKNVEADSWHLTQYKSKVFKGGDYSDWRLPSIDELKTIYNKSSKNKYRTIDFVTLTIPYIYSQDISDETWRSTSLIKYLNFKNGKIGSVGMDGDYLAPGKVTYLPVRNTN
jgi:hypothetical protein